MLSSSASRREAARSCELGRTYGGEPPRPSPAAKARSGELLKGAAAGATAAAAVVRHEGWMVRYGRRKIGRSFFHTRYFVLDNKLLAYYKKQPKDNMVPLKALVIDGNCRVEDRGLKTHHGQMVYVLCVYNKKEKDNPITMGAHDIEGALAWKKKIELLIDQQQDTMTAKNRKAFASLDFDMDLGGPLSFSDHDSGPEDEEEPRPTLLRRTTIGRGLPDSVHDWTKEPDIGLSNQNDTNQVNSRKNWRLLTCQNGLRIFEELVEVEYLARSCSRAMRAVGVVEATCEAIFGLIMSMDVTRYEWDCSFQYGSLVEEVDGHTAILYHRLQLNWCSMLVWPRDLCYVRYWRRNDDGSYVVLFRSTEHQNCGPQPGFARASIESGGFKISPLKSVNGRPRTQVQHLMQIDLKGWGVNYVTSFQYHSLLQMLNCVAGLREYFSQTDDIQTVPRIPVMTTMANAPSVKTDKKRQEADSKTKQGDSAQADTENSDMIDEESEEDDDCQVPETSLEEDNAKFDSDTKCSDPIDLSCFSGIIRQDTNEKSRNCWAVPDSKIFKVRSKNFSRDKSKVSAGKYLMELVAVDWFKDNTRMDHVAKRKGCAAQVAAEKGMFSFVVNIQIPGSSHYSLVLYFVTRSLKKGSLLQRFADADDDFRNSRLKLIPSVPKGSWIVRQSVGSTPCLLGKAVDCSYIRGPEYMEVDVDIGSSAVANGVLGLVFGVVTSLVVDMAFLIQANTYDELPEQLLGAARFSHIEPSAAVVPKLDNISPAGRQFPDKAIDLIDEACAGVKLHVEKQKQVEDEQNSSSINAPKAGIVTTGHVSQVVSRWTKLPCTILDQEDNDKLTGLPEKLQERVVGQDEAVNLVVRAVLRSRVGICQSGQPIASFLFLGPVGVGKTQLAKTLAEKLFDNKKMLRCFDMSEYAGSGSVSRLIGGPRRYEEEGLLTEEVRRYPYSVILLDEVDKADPSVFKFFIQLLDDGILTDGKGHDVDFKNTVIVMTSNLGADQQCLTSREAKENTKKDAHELLMKQVQRRLKPELVSRLSETVIFEPLSHSQPREIVRIQTESVAARLANKGVSLFATDAALDVIWSESHDPVYGARPVKMWVQKNVTTTISDMLINGEARQGSTISIDASHDKKGLKYQVVKKGDQLPDLGDGQS